MADFPLSPIPGDVFTAEDGSVWIWDGYSWRSESGFGGGGGGTGNGNVTLTVAVDPPVGADPNTSLWWDSNTGQLRIYYGDEDTEQWVDAFTLKQGVQGTAGLAGTDGQDGQDAVFPSGTVDGHVLIYDQPTDSWSANNHMRNLNFRHYSERFTSATVNLSTWTIDCSTFNMHILYLQNSITLLNITNVPSDANTSFTLTLLFPETLGYAVNWGANIKWRDGRLPSFSSLTGSVNMVVLTTYDGGSTWLGTPANNYRTV